MKKSTAVTLVLSGSLLAGCDNRPVDSGISGDGTTTGLTNNTYRADYGYWHAPYRAWYPYPYNYYTPGYGYYYGGRWSDQPGNGLAPVPGSSGHSFFGGSSSGFFHSFGTTRGGFGSSGHGFGGGGE